MTPYRDHSTMASASEERLQKRFEQEAERIRSILGNKVLQLEHVGYTSVPGQANHRYVAGSREFSWRNGLRFRLWGRRVHPSKTNVAYFFKWPMTWRSPSNSTSFVDLNPFSVEEWIREKRLTGCFCGASNRLFPWPNNPFQSCNLYSSCLWPAPTLRMLDHTVWSHRSRPPELTRPHQVHSPFISHSGWWATETVVADSDLIDHLYSLPEWIHSRRLRYF